MYLCIRPPNPGYRWAKATIEYLRTRRPPTPSEKHSATQSLPISSPQSTRNRLGPSSKPSASATHHPDLFSPPVRLKQKYPKPTLNYPAPISAATSRCKLPASHRATTPDPQEPRPLYSAKFPTCRLPFRPETSLPFSSPHSKTRPAPIQASLFFV